MKKRDDTFQNDGMSSDDLSSHFLEARKKQKRSQTIKFSLAIILSNIFIYISASPVRKIEIKRPPTPLMKGYQILQWPTVLRTPLSSEKRKTLVSLLKNDGVILVAEAYLHNDKTMNKTEAQVNRKIEISNNDLEKLVKQGLPYIMIVPPIKAEKIKPRKNYEITF